MFRVAITFVCALMVSVTTLIGSAAAKNWNMSDTKSDPTNFWNKTKNAKSCNGPEFDHIRDKISIKKIKIKDTVYENLNAPLGLRSSAYCKFNYASKMVPKPLVDAKIDSKYGGKDQKRFQPIYEFLNTNIGLNRLEPAGVAASRLKKFLLSWSSADALSKNIRFTLMKKFRLDFHVQSLLPPMIIAYSDVSGSLTKNERVQVGSWLNRLVEQSQQSDFIIHSGLFPDSKKLSTTFNRLIIFFGFSSPVASFRSALNCSASASRSIAASISRIASAPMFAVKASIP